MSSGTRHAISPVFAFMAISFAHRRLLARRLRRRIPETRVHRPRSQRAEPPVCCLVPFLRLVQPSHLIPDLTEVMGCAPDRGVECNQTIHAYHRNLAPSWITRV